MIEGETWIMNCFNSHKSFSKFFYVFKQENIIFNAEIQNIRKNNINYENNHFIVYVMLYFFI